MEPEVTLDESEDINKSSSEDVEEIYDAALQSMTAQSFSELATPAQDDICEDISELSTALKWIILNIRNDMTTTPDQKKTKVLQAVTDFNTIVNEVANSTPETPENPLLAALKSLVKARKFKTEGGKKYYASDYAYVPDAQKPSTWKLRLADGSSGNVTVAQLGRAAAAFSSGGFRGNKVQLPSGSVASAKAKIRAAYKRLGVKTEDIPDSLKEANGMMFFKDNTGHYRWIAEYSNSYRDDDNPSEIISDASHKRFVDLVDNKEVDMPELWHWHIPGSKWGTADFVAFDEENGIAMASGTVDPGHENEAYELSKQVNTIRVSHGMPVTSIKRDSTDPSVIVEHVTREISDLPSWAAANSLTGFQVTATEDQEMGLPDAKKEYLKRLGYSDTMIEMLEAGNVSKANTALELGIERKDNGVVEEPPATPAQAQSETPPPVEAAPPAQSDDKGKVVGEFVTKEEMKVFSDTVATTMAEVLKALNGITEKLESQETELKAVKERNETIESQAWTPRAFSDLLIKNMSAIGSADATVRKDAGITKGPEQTDPVKKNGLGMRTGYNLLDDALETIVMGGNKNA